MVSGLIDLIPAILVAVLLGWAMRSLWAEMKRKE